MLSTVVQLTIEVSDMSSSDFCLDGNGQDFGLCRLIDGKRLKPFKSTNATARIRARGMAPMAQMNPGCYLG